MDLYLLTALGITVGFHRLFAYRSIEANSQIKLILAVLDSMVVQGSLFDWVTRPCTAVAIRTTIHRNSLPGTHCHGPALCYGLGHCPVHLDQPPQ